MLKRKLAPSDGRRPGLPVKIQAKRRAIKEPRTVVVSFRLRQSEVNLLLKRLRERPIEGVKSVKQYARMLAIGRASELSDCCAK